ncbi:MAG: endo-1,4-beta-xylanase, partial [Terriglobales bacterium]
MKWRASSQALVLAAVAFCLGFDSDIREPLREAAKTSGMLIGTAVRPAQLSEAAYSSTLAREFNMVEPEDALKWGVVHPERESFDFSEADQIVDFAVRHNMKVRGHTLVWHRQNPKWLTEGKYTSAELSEILERHIKAVVGHYRSKIFAWDVVNEAFDELHPGELRSTIWRDQPGIALSSDPARSKQTYAYIEQCFRWAHEADPQA